MKLAIRAYVVALILLTLVCAAAGQKRSAKDPRNQAPTVGGGAGPAGPTGLFTVYDGSTLRKGEWTISIAATNYDRDPGDVDITDVPVSFNVGLTDKLELFFSSVANREVLVHAPRNLSGFYLPNTQLFVARPGGPTFLGSAPAIVWAPSGPGNGPFENMAVFRPTGYQPFVPYPFNGGNAGTFGLQFPFFSGPAFGFPAGTNALLGPPQGTANGAALFPGIGSPSGGILPGIVLQTVTLRDVAGNPVGEGPSVFTISPSYLPSMPFLNRHFGQSSFDDFTIGVKWRWTSNSSPIGIGIIPFWRWYPDKPVWDLTWADQFKGKHKQIFDLGSFDVSEDDPLRLPNNYLNAFRDVYQAEPPDVSVAVGIARAAFPFNASDVLWEKFKCQSRPSHSMAVGVVQERGFTYRLP